MDVLRTARGFAVPVLFAASALFAPGLSSLARAADTPVRLGEVSTELVRRDVDLRALLRSASEQELGALDWTHVRTRKHAILSMSLVRMETVASAGATSTTCVVSATLRDARRGAIFAILEGKARATSDPSASMERSAIEAAVRGAMARIPEALKR